MAPANPLLQTPRLHLLAPDPEQAAAVADYLQRNSAHFAPWDAPQPPDHATPQALRSALADAAAAFASGRAHRWWLVSQDAPQRVVGSVHLSNIVRGAFHSCMLGYAIDLACQGQGLMQEALAAVVAEAFSPRVNLHRIQAAVQPHNQRSLALLARLGFADEGLARDYLYIAGAWRDHRILARRHPGFIAPAAW